MWVHKVRETGEPKTRMILFDFNTVSPPPPTAEVRTSRLDPYKATIDAWLREDKQNRHKQRHTAQRVFDRLTVTLATVLWNLRRRY